MIRRFAKYLAETAARLKAEGLFEFENRTQAYLRGLRLEEQMLERKHRQGRPPLEIGRLRAEVWDDLLCHLMDEAVTVLKNAGRKVPEITLIALGGYGRRELNPKSDVDITWIHGGKAKLPPGFEQIVKDVYDFILACNLDPGHSTRSLDETIREANKEMKSRTAMVEARWVWGDKALYERFHSRFFKECVRPYVDEYLLARMADQAQRHAQNDGSVFVQQPNLKSGCGGLRDYQNLLWMAFFQRVKTENLKAPRHEPVTTEDLLKWRLLDETERRQIDRAYEFIFKLRTELHYLTGLHTDVIFVNQQRDLADRLGYKEKYPDVLRRTEALMRDYYLHARNIFEITELVSGRMALPMPEAPKPRGAFARLLLLKRRRGPKREEFDGFVAVEGRLGYQHRHIFREDKSRMMRLFRHVQQRGLEMSPELRQLVRRRLKYVDKTFRYAKANREIFAEILRQKGNVGRILRAMHRVDFLGRWMPEFGELTVLVQHEHYHRYTVDEHTLVCIEKLDALLDTEDERLGFYKHLFQKLEDPFPLYLALILHDTGKAANVKIHSAQSAQNAMMVARRLQLPREQRQLLTFLVDSHDLLGKTARQRDLQDPDVIEEVASIVRTQSNLDALLLHTVADGMGVGDGKMWNDWTESLIRTLHRMVSLFLEDSEGFRKLRQTERQALEATVKSELPADFEAEVSAHFAGMPDRYFMLHGPSHAEEVAAHVRLFREFLDTRWNTVDAALRPVVRWTPHGNAGHSELWVCTWDRRQLLARIAGAISATELNILSADIFTRVDGLVLDKFRVATGRFEAVEDKRDLRKVEHFLDMALAGADFDFGAEIEKAYRNAWKREQPATFAPRVYYDNKPATHTVVEITAPDRIGLLYDLLRTIAEQGYEIVSARITTEKGAAIDTFYLTLAEGARVPDDGRLDVLKKALLEVGARVPRFG